MADLDGAHRRVDAQVAGPTGGLLRCEVDDGEEEGVFAGLDGLDPAGEVFGRRERPVGQIRPVSPLGVERVRLVERIGVAAGLERLEAAEAALHDCARGPWPRGPVGQGLTYGLTEVIRVRRLRSGRRGHGATLAHGEGRGTKDE